MTDRINHYILVSENTAEALNTKVNELIAKGYRPHGNAMVAHTPWQMIFTQTMVKFTSRQPINYERVTVKEG